MNGPDLFFDFGDFSFDDFSPVTIKETEKPFEEMTNSEIEHEIVRIRIDIKKEKAWQESLNISDEKRLKIMGDMYVKIKKYYMGINEKYREHVQSKNYKPALRIGGQTW